MASKRGSYYKKKKRVYKSPVRSKYSKKTREIENLVSTIINILALLLVCLLVYYIYTNVIVKKTQLDVANSDVAALNISYSAFEDIQIYSKKYNIDFPKALTLYCAENKFFPSTPVVHESEWIEQNFIFNYEKIKNLYSAKKIEPYEKMFKTILTEIKYFPIPTGFAGEKEEDYMYGNSWGAVREYAGNRTHMGTDIVDRENIRGRIPVVSMTDGVIEHLGWNELGGFRIGVRSTSGTYYYYAHLSEFAQGLNQGDIIDAGESIGYMGDTGYSKKEGTTGNFVVHLHIGISYNAPFSKDELWINPYVFLRNIELTKIAF